MKTKYTLLVLSFLVMSSLYSQSWTPLGLGLNDKGRVLLNDTVNNRLIVGGDFTYAGTQNAPFVASWDGTNWQAMGAGFNAPVYALALFNNEIYAGGSFTMSGTDTVKHLAKWNGINWEAVGNVNANNEIKYLNSYQGKLYISGDFTSYGNINRKNVTWNGTAFDSISGFQNYYPITDIAFYKFKTYFSCGPMLVSSNGFSYQYISASNGCVSFQSPIYIKSLQVHQNMLYLAGPNNDPDIFGDYYANTVGVFDGITCQGYNIFNAHWATNGPVNKLKSIGNDLYMGGYFDKSDFGALNVGNIPTYNINRFNATTETFYSVNYGTDEEIYDMELYKGSLYIVGRFISAGFATANFIAKLPCIIKPTVTLSSFSSICSNATPIQLTGGIPAGGIYSGAGVSGDSFDPSTVSIGNHTIVYTYVDSFSGCSNSQSKPITISICAGIEELVTNGMNIFPNPNNGLFNITMQNNFLETKLEIYNMLGEKIYHTQLNNTTTEIDLTKETKGIYFYKLILENSNKTITGKLIVQ